MIEVPDHVYVLRYTYPCHTLNTTDTRKNIAAIRVACISLA